MPATGVLRDDRVVVPDGSEASTVHNKGSYGTPVSGGGLDLALVEALYLVELDRLAVQDHGFVDLLVHGTRARQGFEIRYLTYRDLRTRGFVVTLAGDRFDVFPRGRTPKDAEPEAVVRPISERASFRLTEVVEDRDRARDAGRDLLLALVDEEGDLTYYRIEEARLDGDAPPDPDEVDGEALMLGDRVVVPDPTTASRLHDEAFYGRLVHDALQLSLVEAAHLRRRGLAVQDSRTGEVLDGPALGARARDVQPDFDLRFRTYEALKDRDLLVKTGFKYGTHFRVYRTDPDRGHAELLVQAVPADYEAPWPKVAGFVRMAQSVRKTMVLASPDDGLGTVAFSRARP